MRIEWKKRLLLLCRSRYLVVTARNCGQCAVTTILTFVMAAVVALAPTWEAACRIMAAVAAPLLDSIVSASGRLQRRMRAGHRIWLPCEKCSPSRRRRGRL